MKGAVGSPAPHHVEPKLFLLENGVLVLSSGRAGCYVWTLPLASLRPGMEGEALWTGFNLLAAHNTAVTAGNLPTSWSYPASCVESKGHSPPCSTYYTSMTVLPVSEAERAEAAASVVVAYDRTPNGWNPPVKGGQQPWGDLLFSLKLTVRAS